MKRTNFRAPLTEWEGETSLKSANSKTANGRHELGAGTHATASPQDSGSIRIASNGRTRSLELHTSLRDPRKMPVELVSLGDLLYGTRNRSWADPGPENFEKKNETRLSVQWPQQQALHLLLDIEML